MNPSDGKQVKSELCLRSLARSVSVSTRRDPNVSLFSIR